MSSSCVSNSVTFYVFMKFHYNFYVSVWLDHLKELHQLINNEAQIAGDFLESGKRIFTNASTNSIVDIISMSQKLNDCNLADHISFFKTYLNGLPARLAEIYSVYRLFSQEVS